MQASSSRSSKRDDFSYSYGQDNMFLKILGLQNILEIKYIMHVLHKSWLEIYFGQ